MDSFDLSSTRLVAGIGPVSMMTGSTPARAKVWNRARGVRPRAAAFSSLMISATDAPSVICELLSAVTFPPALNAGSRLASVSAVVPARRPSSVPTTSPDSTTLPVSLSLCREVTATISLSKRPSAVAVCARLWLRAPKRSRASRLRFHFSAIISAETPCGTSPSTSP